MIFNLGAFQPFASRDARNFARALRYMEEQHPQKKENEMLGRLKTAADRGLACLGYNYFDMSDISAAVRAAGGGGYVHLRNGNIVTLNEDMYSGLVDRLRVWAETRAPRPNPGTDKADNDLPPIPYDL